jgi:hypothetical protein
MFFSLKLQAWRVLICAAGIWLRSVGCLFKYHGNNRIPYSSKYSNLSHAKMKRPHHFDAVFYVTKSIQGLIGSSVDPLQEHLHDSCP